MLMRQKT
ncbi:hypothetical protein LEMLEM_LOCUS12284 [Lemmus lemmus]